jgi:hypothetical protein
MNEQIDPNPLPASARSMANQFKDFRLGTGEASR